MNLQKKYIVAVATIAILTAGGIAATRVSAQTTSDNRMSSLVQKIADKFGLNKDDVQAVFDQDKSDRMAQMETKYEDRLTQLVSDGKITEDQKALILSKHKELMADRQTQMNSLKNMTKDERKMAMEAKHRELENWAKENNIDIKYLMIGMHGGRGHGKWNSGQNM